MADSSYESEVQSILAFLSMQHPSSSPSSGKNSDIHIDVEEFVAPRYLRKLKSRQVESLVLHAQFLSCHVLLYTALRYTAL